jgi:hypothetical protein
LKGLRHCGRGLKETQKLIGSDFFCGVSGEELKGNKVVDERDDGKDTI